MDSRLSRPVRNAGMRECLTAYYLIRSYGCYLSTSPLTAVNCAALLIMIRNIPAGFGLIAYIWLSVYAMDRRWIYRSIMNWV